MSKFEVEGKWPQALGPKPKAYFLASLGHAITVVGRNRYEVQPVGLEKPAQLRRVNEAQHRVLQTCVTVSRAQATASSRSQ